jgi:hypothetical protein
MGLVVVVPVNVKHSTCTWTLTCQTQCLYVDSDMSNTVLVCGL